MCDFKQGPQIGAILINNSFNKVFLTFKKIKGPKKSVFLGQKLNKLDSTDSGHTDGYIKHVSSIFAAAFNNRAKRAKKKPCLLHFQIF